MNDILLVAYDESNKNYLYDVFMANFASSFDISIIRDICKTVLSYSSVNCLYWLVNGVPKYSIALDEFGAPKCSFIK